MDKFVGQERYKSHTEAERKEFTKNAQIFLFWKDLAQAEELARTYEQRLRQHREFICTEGFDPPEIANWQWRNGGDRGSA